MQGHLKLETPRAIAAGVPAAGPVAALSSPA